MKRVHLFTIIAVLLLYGKTSEACTGISMTAGDKSYIQARTIEWGGSNLESQYVIVPRNMTQTSYTPTGVNGLTFKSKYGYVGLAVVQKEFVAEGINEAGLSAGLFYFPNYGSYKDYDSKYNSTTIADLQLVSWMLSQFATVDEVVNSINNVRVVSIQNDENSSSSAIHWRVGDPSGKQIVIEIVDGVTNIYNNTVGVLTNSPGFPWQLTNLNNYVNLHAGSAAPNLIDGMKLSPTGAGSGLLGLPGDYTPPSRFVRVAFFKATAPVLNTALETVNQCFNILNNFDIPIGTENTKNEITDLPSATQWTSVIDLTHKEVYFKTMYNNTIRKISLDDIDFAKVKYQSHPLDKEKVQPIVDIKVR